MPSDNSIKSHASKWVSTSELETTRSTWPRSKHSLSLTVSSSFKLPVWDANGNTRILSGVFSWVSISSPELMLHALSTGTSTRLREEASKSRPLETRESTTLTPSKCGTTTSSRTRPKLKVNLVSSPTAFTSFSLPGALWLPAKEVLLFGWWLWLTSTRLISTQCPKDAQQILWTKLKCSATRIATLQHTETLHYILKTKAQSM